MKPRPLFCMIVVIRSTFWIFCVVCRFQDIALYHPCRCWASHMSVAVLVLVLLVGNDTVPISL